MRVKDLSILGLMWLGVLARFFAKLSGAVATVQPFPATAKLEKEERIKKHVSL